MNSKRLPYPWVGTRIIHLSDLHLTTKDGDVRSEPKIFGKLKGMNERFRQLLGKPVVREADAILVTGDITDSGEPKQWQVFWDAVGAAGAKDRVIVVPGNHDCCCLGLSVPSIGESRWEKDMKRLDAGLAFGGQRLRFPAVRFITPYMAVFLVNSNNMGNTSVASNAVGLLAYFDLVRLAELLHKHRDVPVKTVALHHSPNIPEADTAKRRGDEPTSWTTRLMHQIPQEQRRALRLLCLTHRVRLIAHGHLHLCENRRVNGISIVGAPASTEPVQQGGQAVCRVWQYSIKGASGLLRRRMLSMPVTV